MWLNNFFYIKSNMGTPLDSICFTHQKKSVTGLDIFCRSDHLFSVRWKISWYDSIWLKKINFCQKSYGNKTRVNFFLSELNSLNSIYRFRKSCKIVQNLSKNQPHHFQSYDLRIVLVSKFLWEHHSISDFFQTTIYWSLPTT